MTSSIQKRLKALEAQRKGVDADDQDELSRQIAEKERQACLMTSWTLHRDGQDIDSVLPRMLRYVDESEARRLLAMDYESIYRAVGLTVFTTKAPEVERDR